MRPSDAATNGSIGGAAAPGERPRWARALFLAAAFGAWLWSALAHEFGTEVAHDYFEWAKAPGRLCAEGGAAGVRAAELLVEAVFVVVAAGLVAFAVRRIRTLPAEERRERLLAWALWGAVVHLLWKCYIMFASEFVHFGQYALIAVLLHAGLRRETRAVAAFLIATFLGLLDEGWQHWGLALWVQGFHWHGYEWSDTMLNAAGACGGVLLVASPRGTGDAAAAPRRLLAGAVAVLAALLLPLLLLSRVALAKIFGSYSYATTWEEYDIGKSAHWMTPFDGIPLLLATLLLLGRLVCGVRALATRGVALALVLLATVAVDRPSRVEGRIVHEDVPTVVARRAAPGRIHVDGVLDEPEWAEATRLGPFVRNVPEYPDHPLPDDARVMPAATTARVVWDDRALYVAFEMEDKDVWARRAARDDPALPGDEVVEVFVDPGGDEVRYYEFEFSPLGVVYDLFNYVPETPSDFEPTAPYVGLAGWDARDVACAVKVRGTLDVVDDFAPSAPLDEDGGWTIEIAIPWSAFRTTTTPSSRTRLHLPPAPGDRWRLGLFRVERPRASREGKLLGRAEAEHLAQFQAWSPTYKETFHRPERFGVLEFADR
jgi:hypothetical protein